MLKFSDLYLLTKGNRGILYEQQRILLNSLLLLQNLDKTSIVFLNQQYEDLLFLRNIFHVINFFFSIKKTKIKIFIQNLFEDLNIEKNLNKLKL